MIKTGEIINIFRTRVRVSVYLFHFTYCLVFYVVLLVFWMIIIFLMESSDFPSIPTSGLHPKSNSKPEYLNIPEPRERTNGPE